MLPTGTRLGPYKILTPLGASETREAYRAQDSRTGREVALRILPPEMAADPGLLRSVESQARTVGALDHPNLVALHELGQDGGRAFLVGEPLEGETLRARLAAGPLPLRRALDYGVQIAQGLAAAHSKGITHRDLRPENLFVTRDGQVKILDFGLAQPIPPPAVSDSAITALTESAPITSPAGYQAPEQVRGEEVDPRADLFALGCVLHEMLTGKRAFAAGTASETRRAILEDEPPPLAESHPELPPAVPGIIAHCLEKDPERRFQSATDVAFLLTAVTSGTPPDAYAAVAARPRMQVVSGVLLLVAAAAATIWIGLHARRAPPPTFEQLTFRRGSIGAARYSPDGRTIVYSAAWDGEPERICTTRLESRESSPLPLPDARLLAVSSSGELAIAVGPGVYRGTGDHTTLARVPLAGGAPRELLENVLQADWSPDGQDLAVLRFAKNAPDGAVENWLEYPIGRTLYRSDAGLVDLRVSPDGNRVALLEQETSSDFSRGAIVVVDRKGAARRLTPVWYSIQGLAWSPRGDEVWYTAVHRGTAKALRAVSLAGRDRLILNAPGAQTLEDVGRDGQVLISRDQVRVSTLGRAPDSDRERDLSWQDNTAAAGLSADGRTLIFTEWGEAAGTVSVIGMRGTDGSPVVKLGEGYAGGLSPDGRWVVGILITPRRQLSLLPTGAGQARSLDPGPVRDIDWSCWAPDGQHVVFLGREPGHGRRAYVQDVNGGPPRAFTPDGVSGGWQGVSPDSRWLLATLSGSPKLFPLDGGPARSVPGLGTGDAVIHWTADGRALLVRALGWRVPTRIERLDIATGARRPVRNLTPMDPVGVTGIQQIFFTPDERAYVYTLSRKLSCLFQAQGLR